MLLLRTVFALNLVKIEIEVPEILLNYINYSDKEYHKRIQELMLYQLITEDKISFGKAAEILGIDKISFIANMSKIGISYYDNDISDVVQDSINAGKYIEVK